MYGNSSGAPSVIKKQQPLAEYTHCGNHIVNLAISFACKNQSIKKFMAYLISVCFFFENYPKRQKFFEYFTECYKDKLKLPDTKGKQITDLSKRKWVERDGTYDTYYLLFKVTLYIFKSIFSSNIHIMSFTCI